MSVELFAQLLFLSLLCFASSLFAAQVRLKEGTPVRVRLKTDLISDQVDEGSRIDLEVARPVTVRGLVAVPEGAVAWGAVQSVKKGKFIKFDIEGVRLPDLSEVKLRCVPEKTKNPAKDQIKIESEFGDSVGAPRGSEFTAYTDEDATVEAKGALPAPATAVRPTLRPAAIPAPVAPAEMRRAAPAVAAPSRPAPQPVAPAPAPAPAAAATGERITVECFSDPSGADIVIDGEFYGTTPSILKIPVGNHRLEIQLSGYKSFSQSLDLPSGSGLRTVRTALEKKQ